MRTYTAILAATTVIGGVVAIHLWAQLRAERERDGQLQERVTRLELAQAAPVRSVAASPALSGAGQQTSPVSATGPVTASTVAVASSARSGLASAINTRELLKDPDFREGMAPTVRASMAMMYPDLARELGLTPEQAGKLLDLITKHQMATMAMTAQSGYPDQAAMNQMSKTMQENSRKQEAEVSALLGEAKYQQWKEYQGTLGVRQQVSRLHSALESSGQPLEEYQEKSLISALAADQKRQAEDAQRSSRTASAPPRDVTAALEEGLQRNEASNNRALDVASSYLNASQLDVMRKVQSQQTSMMRAMLRAQRAQTDAQGSGLVDAPH